MQFDRRYFINMEHADRHIAAHFVVSGHGLLRRIQFRPCKESSLNLAHPVAQTGRAGSGSIDTGISGCDLRWQLAQALAFLTLAPPDHYPGYGYDQAEQP